MNYPNHLDLYMSGDADAKDRISKKTAHAIQIAVFLERLL